MNRFRDAARRAAEEQIDGARRPYFPAAGATAVLLVVVGLLIFAIDGWISHDQNQVRLAASLAAGALLGVVAVALVIFVGIWMWVYREGFVRQRRLERMYPGKLVFTSRDFYLDSEGHFAARLYDFFTFDRGVTLDESGFTFWRGATPQSVLVLPRERITAFALELRTGGAGKAAKTPREALVLTLAGPDETLVFRVADHNWLNVRVLDRVARHRLLEEAARVLGGLTG